MNNRVRNLAALTLFSLFLSFGSFAQYTLSGRVTDADRGNPLPGAHVTLKPTALSTAADLNGQFTFHDLKKGQYQVKITFVGYESLTKKVMIDADKDLEFQMEQKPVLQDEVVVQATRAGALSPTTFENVQGEELQRKNLGKDLPFLLDTRPSVVVTSDAGNGIGYTNIRIRGTDITGINVTVNGIPLNDPESHGVWFVDLPDFASSIDNLQIQRGVGTSANGASAFGASINIQTQKPATDPYGEISTGYGSFNTFKRNVKLGTGLINGRWSFDGRLSRITSDGYVDRASSDLSSLFLSGAYYGEKTALKANIIRGKEVTYQAWMGIPRETLDTNRTYNPMGRYIDKNGKVAFYDDQTDNYWQDHYHLILNQKLSTKLMLNTTLFYIKGKGYYEEYRENEALSGYGLDDVITGSDTVTHTDLIRRLWLDNDFFGAVYSLNYEGSGKLNAAIGGGVNSYTGDHFGRVIWAEYAASGGFDHKWYDNTGVKNDFNIFGRLNMPAMDNLVLYLDIQYRHIGYEIDGFDKDFRDISQKHTYDFFNPKAGITYLINHRQKAYLSFAISNREPNRVNFTDREEGAPVPVHETLRNLEAGYEITDGKSYLKSTVYYMDYKNQLVLTGRLNDVGNPIKENVPASYRAGIEISGSLKLTESLSWFANATFSRNKIKSYTDNVVNFDTWPFEYEKDELGETDIAFSPDITANSIIEWTPWKNTSVNLVSKYVGKQYFDNTSSEERKLEPYMLHDVVLRFSPALALIRNVELTFSVNNILDEAYESFAWVYRYYAGGQYYEDTGLYPQAGRHFMAGLSLKF